MVKWDIGQTVVQTSCLDFCVKELTGWVSVLILFRIILVPEGTFQEVQNLILMLSPEISLQRDKGGL